MRQFGENLEFANFYRNEITYLDADLFAYNKNVKFLGFGSNPLKFIDFEFIENLKSFKNIQIIRLGGTNACLDEAFNRTLTMPTFKILTGTMRDAETVIK